MVRWGGVWPSKLSYEQSAWEILIASLSLCRDSWVETCRRRVDFPIPGSPPMRTRLPGTTPPPSTRLNSSISVLGSIDIDGGHFSQFHRLGFLTCQGHTRILYLGNLNLFYKGRPRPTVRTSSQIFRGIIPTILTYKCRFFFCDDKPLSISLTHTQSLGKNQSSRLVQIGAWAFRELQW